MITSYNLEISLRIFLENKYGYPTVLKKQRWKVPDTKPFMTIESPTSTYNMLAKDKELIQENVLLEIGCFADSEHELNALFSKVKLDILYVNIPLLDDDGIEVGKFSFSEIVADSGIIDDVQTVEDETNLSRRYLEARTHLALLKTN